MVRGTNFVTLAVGTSLRTWTHHGRDYRWRPWRIGSARERWHRECQNGASKGSGSGASPPWSSRTAMPEHDLTWRSRGKDVPLWATCIAFHGSLERRTQVELMMAR